jgi:exodeoxyribonuclease V gamma subunit
VVPLAEAIFSNSLDQLFASLLNDVRVTPSQPLLRARIVVPEHSLRAWLCHELAKTDISLLRVEVLPITEALESTSQLTRANLLPLLVSFLESHLPSPVERYRLGKRLLLPFALKAFLGDGRALAAHPDAQELWKKFEAWSPLSISPQMTALSDTPLFLFGFSSLHPQLLHHLLSLPCLRGLYLLSPCMLFWGDQSSDHEAKRLLAIKNTSRPSTEQLEAFLDDRHKLLANSGQVGREFLSAIEDSSLQTRTQYVFPDTLLRPPYSEFLLPETIIAPTEESPSILDHLKADLLTLVSKRAEPYELSRDRSIEVHAAPTILREVEALYERLGALKELPPASVLVLTTDLRRYSAAIEQVLGKQVPYQVWGETNPSGAIAAHRMLIALLQSRGSLTEWIQLLRHPVFQRSLKISEDEAEAVIDWLNTRPIQWGLSHEHKKRYLEQRAIVSANQHHSSFADERDHLLNILLSESAETTPSVSLLPAIGAFLHFLQHIEGWWPLPLETSSFASLTDMSALLNTVTSLLVDQNAGGFEEEALLSASATFSQIAQQTSSPQLPIAESLRLFDRSVLAHLSTTAFYLRAPVIVAEFGAFEPFPAQLVAVLGANAGILPRYNEEKLFDRLDRLVATLPASNTFVDRYSFLEAILSAKNLFIGYQSYAFDLKEALQPSPIVDDLFNHMDQQYRVEGTLPSKALLFNHLLARPLRPTSPKQPAKPLHAKKADSQQIVDLKQIERAARSPLQIFFAEQFSLSLLKQKSELLFSSPWETQDHITSNLGKATPKAPPNPLVERAQKRTEETLRELSIHSLTRFDLHLLPTVTKPHTSSTTIFSPTISGSSEIFGSWPGLICEGLVLLSDNWERELFKKWPECSVRAYCAHTLGLPFQQRAIIIAEKKILPLPESPQLQEWGEFTSLARTTAFPFTFEIVKQLIDHTTPEELFQKIEEEAKVDPLNSLWSAYLHTSSVEKCAHELPMLERYATLLWSSFFSVLEGK